MRDLDTVDPNALSPGRRPASRGDSPSTASNDRHPRSNTERSAEVTPPESPPFWTLDLHIASTLPQ
jgi:hypothetical protein